MDTQKCTHPVMGTNECIYLHQKHMHSILDTELHKITDLCSNTHIHKIHILKKEVHTNLYKSTP